MSELKIYHNPRCSKSRQTLRLINEAKKEVEIIEYLKAPPSEEELRDLVEKLKLPVEYLVRKNEDIYKEKYKGQSFTDDEWIKILNENPILIERPIVVRGNEAIIGRPPENVVKLMT